MTRPFMLRARITELERDLIQRLAQRENMTPSEFIRLAIREAAKARGIPAVGVAELYEVISIAEAQNDDQTTK